MSAVIEIDAARLSPLQRQGNKALMVSWINAKLVERAGHDVRKSIVLYDGDYCFVYALAEVPDEFMLTQLRSMTEVRYFSKGI